MNQINPQGSGKDRSRKLTDFAKTAEPNSVVDVIPVDHRPYTRRFFFGRKGAGDSYEINSVSYRLERAVGTGLGEGVGKSETWEATEVSDSGKKVFLKKFNSPKYPNEQERNDPAIGPELLKRWERFSTRHKNVSQLLSRDVVGFGTLVKPLNFGLAKDTVSFCKVYPWVSNAVIINSNMVKTWSIGERLIFLRTLLLGLWELHSLGIVHGDIKCENILVVKQPIGYVARLIDFDEAFVADSPPLSFEESDVGTTHMTPEWRVLEAPDLVKDAQKMRLGTPNDIFLLSVLLEEVFGNGHLTWSKRDGSNFSEGNADASIHGFEPSSSDLGLGLPRLRQQLRQALDCIPSRRPTVKSLLSTIGVTVR